MNNEGFSIGYLYSYILEPPLMYKKLFLLYTLSDKNISKQQDFFPFNILSATHLPLLLHFLW